LISILVRAFRAVLGRLLMSNRFAEFYLESLVSGGNFATNQKLLKLALQGAGFNPSDSGSSNGEKMLMETLAKLGCRSAIDVGANVGAYSRQLIESGFLEVTAFEPHPASYQELVELKEGSCGALVTHQLAVSSSAGTSVLHFDQDRLVLASMREEVSSVPYVNFSDSIEVETVTLDGFFLGQSAGVDLIKVDTEGFERDVLSGAKSFLMRFPPVAVQIEFNHHHLFTGDSLYSLHKEFLPSYAAYRLLPRDSGFLRVRTDSPFANIFLFSNYVFIRSDFVESFENFSKDLIRG